MFVQNFKRLESLAYVLTQTIKSNSRYPRLAIASLHFFFPRPIHDGLYDLLTMRPSCEGMTREYTLQLKPHSAELSFDARIPQSSMRPNTQLSIPFAVDVLSKNCRWAKPLEQDGRCPWPEANVSKQPMAHITLHARRQGPLSTFMQRRGPVTHNTTVPL